MKNCRGLQFAFLPHILHKLSIFQILCSSFHIFCWRLRFEHSQRNIFFANFSPHCKNCPNITKSNSLVGLLFVFLLYIFLASQDALEVMLFTSCLMVSWLDWCDPGEWWYLKKTWLTCLWWVRIPSRELTDVTLVSVDLLRRLDWCDSGE